MCQKSHKNVIKISENCNVKFFKIITFSSSDIPKVCKYMHGVLTSLQNWKCLLHKMSGTYSKPSTCKLWCLFWPLCPPMPWKFEPSQTSDLKHKLGLQRPAIPEILRNHPAHLRDIESQNNIFKASTLKIHSTDHIFFAFFHSIAGQLCVAKFKKKNIITSDLNHCEQMSGNTDSAFL